MKKLSVRHKRFVLTRNVWPVIGSRCGRWVGNATMLDEVARTQRLMLACLQRLPRNEADTPATYAQRRGRAAAELARDTGEWGKLVAQKIIDWHRHLQRAHVDSWAVRLRAWRSAKWLQGRRALRQSYSLLGGSTGTRVQRARPTRRWDDGR